MSVIAPNSDIYLLKTPFEMDEQNTLTFANATAQYNYFIGLSNKLLLEDATYQRKEGVVRWAGKFDDIIGYNYCMYRNTNYSNKWFYAFIEDIKYINDSTTEIKLKTDVYQSWAFDIVYNKMFVEREHVNDDTIGLHTIPENLETGEYIVNSADYYNGLDNLKYVIQCTEWSGSSANKPLATNYGGVYMAGGAYVCSNMTEVVNILSAFDSRGKADAVYSVYMIPANFITTTQGELQYPGQNAPITANKSITKVNTINGYTPTNKKVLTFPFTYMLLSNNNGSSNILHYERFSGSTCDFTIKAVPTLGGSIKIIPTNYDSNLYSEEMGIMAGKFPTLNWSTDAYTNWLTQNSVNIGLGIASSAITIVGGLGMMATGGGAIAGGSSVVSGAMGIAQTLGSVYEHSLQPNSAKGNTNGGDINVCSGKNGFFFYRMTIKKEYAEVIDHYFNLYGYKVNEVKLPNITGRTNWNFVKTINCNIHGDIPQRDLLEIKELFDKGITFWHNPLTFLDYSQSNTIVT